MARPPRRFIRAAVVSALSMLGLNGPALATHINAPLLANTLRGAMSGEGYLEHKANPLVGRFGQEWTGWVDVRHPALDGTTNAAVPFDRSNRFVNVRTITTRDRNDVAAQPDLIRDFDYNNKIWMQGGLSVVRTESGTLKLDGTGGTPNVEWNAAPPNTLADDDAIKRLSRSADARTINNYYVRRYAGANPPNGITSGPAGYGGNVPRNDGIGLATNQYVNNTFAHELGHMIFNGGAQHAEDPGDAAHSRDRTNLMWSDGTETAQNLNQVGMLGRRDIVTSSQALRAFGNLGNNNPGFVQRNAPDTRYGNRVDWDFVADHGQITFNHNNTTGGVNVSVTGGAENTGNNVDEVNPVGAERLFFEIGNAAAPASQAGHDHTGLGEFAHPGNFAGAGFYLADVFSLGLRYSDYDRDAGGAASVREAALDYDVVFRSAAGATAPGIPISIFELGWSAATNADNYLVRWLSPFEATGVFVQAHLGDNHDYLAQIDAVIVAVPEPASLSAALPILVPALGARRRCRRA